MVLDFFPEPNLRFLLKWEKSQPKYFLFYILHARDFSIWFRLARTRCAILFFSHENTFVDVHASASFCTDIFWGTLIWSLGGDSKLFFSPLPRWLKVNFCLFGFNFSPFIGDLRLVFTSSKSILHPSVLTSNILLPFETVFSPFGENLFLPSEGT